MPLKTSNRAYPCQPSNKEAGYSLIEMAIGLLILGVILASIFHAYSLYITNERMTRTQLVVENAVGRLQAFRQENGFYPCPAPLNADRTDAAYGVPTDCTDVSQPIASCNAGICIEESVRTDMGTKPRVRVGMIPFRALQLDEREISDAYGSRLVYAVTERQAVLATFQEKEGGIDVVDENGTSQVTPAGSANFIIVSHGPNGIGAYNRFGALKQACGGAASVELENCRVFATPPNDAVYAFSALSLSGGANNFDDVVQYFASSETPLWRRENPLSENIVDMSDGNVGVGTASPARTLTIAQSTVATTGGNIGKLVNPNSTSSGQHSGALRASTRIQADSYCEPGALNCFQPKNITGNNASADPDAGLKCTTPGTYMVRIEGTGTNAKAVCAPVRVMCPAATPALIGLKADGSPNCSAILNSCPARTWTHCSTDDVSFGVSGHGFTSSQSRGDCRSDYYTCTNGTWSNSGQTGACVKAATTVTTTVSCGTGFTGTYTRTTNDCGETTSDEALVCPATCVDYTSTQTRACAAPFSGSQSRDVTFSCDVNGVHVPNDPEWTPPCGCSLTDSWDITSCPAGYTRRAAPTPSTFPIQGSAPARNWPSSNTEGQYRLNTVVLPACNMSNPPYDNSNCECNTTARYYAVAHTWADPCKKAATPGGRVNPDGMPVNGYGMGSVPWSHDIVKYDIDVGTCTQSGTGTVVSAAQSQDRVFLWKDQGTIPATPSTSRPSGYPKLDDTCSCATERTTSHPLGCVKADGTVWKYHNCKCLEQ